MCFIELMPIVQILFLFFIFRHAWVRDFCAWKNCINYFPVDVVKTVDLTADRNYLVCMFPHGVFRYFHSLHFTKINKMPEKFTNE